MRKVFIALCALLAGSLALAQDRGDIVKQADGYEWPTDPAVLQKLDQWQDLKFGVLMHWGVYATQGMVESWAICNEEWIRRPEGSVYEDYKKWYWDLSKEFNPVKFNPDQWADVFSKAGMKYMIFTTKHHDGFCMFDTQYTDFSIAKGPFASNPKRDVAKHVFDAFRKKDFMIGAYFSKPDWHHHGFWNPYYATPDRHPNYNIEKRPEWWKSYVDFTQNQLLELTTGKYGKIDILWLDGGWIEGDQVGLNDVLKKARAYSTGMLSVDRTIQGPNENYQTPEQSIPKEQKNHPWESCITLTHSWGWSPNVTFKTSRKVIDILAENDCDDTDIYFTASRYAFEIEPSFNAAIGTAQWYTKQGNHSESIKYYDKAIELCNSDKQKARIAMKVVYALAKSGQGSKAEGYLQKVESFDPSMAGRCDLFRAQSAATAKNWDAALNYARRAGQEDASISGVSSRLISQINDVKRRAAEYDKANAEYKAQLEKQQKLENFWKGK